MANITKEIKIKVSMPDDSSYCQNSDGNACPALSDAGNYCNHLECTLDTSVTFILRAYKCPFTVSKCPACNNIIKTEYLNDLNIWQAKHYCINNVEILSSGENSKEKAIQETINFIIAIKNKFKQR